MKVSKKKIVEKILEYVFNRYCDDEQIAIYLQDYYEAEKQLKNKKPKEKSNIKYYRITEDVRDFLEPLVDAEYFKAYNYSYRIDGVLLESIEQLNTKLNGCLYRDETRNNNTK